MCSMCHHCGAGITRNSDGKELEKGNSLELDTTGPMCLCKDCEENHEQEIIKQDSKNTSETPILRTMVSLSSCDSSISNSSYSDYSGETNSYGRDSLEDSTGSRHEDANSSQDSNVQNSSKACFVNSKPQTVIENFNESNHIINQLSGRDVECVIPNNGQEAAHSGTGVVVDGEIEKFNFNEMDIWEPPEPEDPKDDMEGGMGYNDDDDDEFSDDTEWSKSSSFSFSIDEASGSYGFKETKQKAMKEVINGKYRALVYHLLKSVGISSSEEFSENWVDVVCSLSWEAAAFLKPVVDGKAMDPDGYVKVKCIATGTRNQSQFVKGLVFKKHAAHKHMPTQYKYPKLLLVRGMLGQSSSGLSSFNSMEQENDYVKSVIEMIENCNANVVLVEKTVSRVIQESILKKGMTLVTDMKLHRLERIARCTGSPILSSDTLMSQNLRQCDAVYFQRIVEEHAGSEGGKKPNKTLMFIEGCPTRLGCTILLKGTHSDELKRIKCVLQCAVVMAYHLILETSFLVDLRAMLATILFAEERDVVSSDPQSPLEPCSPHIPEVVNSTDKNGPSTNLTDIHISDHEEVSNGFNVKLEEKPVMYHNPEPYNPAIMSGFTLISDSLKRVIGESFLLSFGSHERDPVFEADSTPSNPTAADQFDVEVRGSSDEENSVHEPSKSLTSPLEGLGEVELANGCSEDLMQNKVDNKTPLNSQSILVLMSSQNALKGTMCEQSHFSHIMFYKNFDIPLGKFLRENLLNQKNLCTVCGELPEAHFYYYAHHRTQLSIQVKQLPLGKVLPGETEGKIWMWSRCRKCKSKKGHSKSTKRVLISTAARGLSFGKFLELSFSLYTSPSKVAGCGHSLFGDFIYFFGLGHMVAMFRYSEAAIYTVSMPSQRLEFSSAMRQERLVKETQDVYTKGILLFTEVANALKKIGSQRSNLNLQGFLKDFSVVEEMLNHERSEFEANIQNSFIQKGNSVLAFHKYLSLNRFVWELLVESCIWDRRFHSLLSPTPTIDLGPSENGDRMVMSRINSNVDVGHEESESVLEDDETVQNVSSHLKVEPDMSVDENLLPPKEIAVEGSDGETEGDQMNVSSAAEIKEIPVADDLSPKKFLCREALSNDFDYHQSDNDSSQVGRISSPGDLDEDRSIQLSAGMNCNSNSSEWFWIPFSEIRQMHMEDIQRNYFPKFESTSSYTPKLLPAANDFINEEGHKLHIPLTNDNYIVSDYDGELSSIIACVLALLKDLPLQTESHNENGKAEGGGVAKSIGNSQSLNRLPSNGSWDVDSLHSSTTISSEESRFSSFDGLNFLDSLVPETFKQADHEGVIKSLAKGKYVVNCPYFNQFRDLRSRCCPSELYYIGSLCRCMNWDAKGGKSKSFFAKTLDDRLIIKDIKKTEYESFMKFAPEYFKYMNQSFDQGNQTCLAKVLGVYQVTVRESKSGKETRHDLMVMENLSFGRNITRQYDLKGALHARYNSAANGLGEVLLDENFVKDMNSSPLYVSNHAKRQLQRAIWNDTTFLNSINVMDYSLLVGVDAEKKELVCGIIDYLRQYTWDKHLETWVKSSLVPKNVLPTVISPKEYKRRFRKFMSAHFLSVPDHWCLQNSHDPCELCRPTNRGSSPLSSQNNDGENDLSS